MTTRPRFPQTKWLFLFALIASLCGTSAAWAQFGPPVAGNYVVYNPAVTQQQQGTQPFHTFYDLTITSPANFSGGTIAIAMVLVVEETPAGVDEATAATYITFRDPVSGAAKDVLTFSGPSQAQTVRVTTDIPLGSDDGTFKYWIKTSGWPSQFVDNGTRINAQAALPSGLTPPAVAIDLPLDGAEFTHVLGQPPVPVSIRVSGAASASAPVLQLEAYLSAVDEGGASILSEIPLGVTLTGLGTADTSGVMTHPVSTPGIYTIRAVATNALGTSTTSSLFVVAQTAPPPAVVIHQPTPGSDYVHYFGQSPATVPFTFTANSLLSGITSLAATIDGQTVTFAASGLNTLTASGSTSFNFTSAGTHQLKVVAKNAYGTAEATTYFTVKVVTPVPAIVITDPAAGDVFTREAGTPDLDIPFAFNTTTSAAFTVDQVWAELDGAPVAIAATAGLGTVSAVSTGTLSSVAPGTHTLTAYGLSSGIRVSTSVTFTVVETQPLPPPTVVIDTPVAGASYTIQQGASQTVNLTFTGTSHYSGGTITGMTATINGQPIAVTYTTSGNLGYGSASFVVSTAGTHVISVTATDAVGTAVAERSLPVSVVAPQNQTVAGTVFFDPNFDGVRSAGEPGLPSVAVKLLTSSGAQVRSGVTNVSGQYSFTSVPAGNYVVVAAAINGLAPTTINEVPIGVQAAPVTVANIGFGLKFEAIRKQAAEGMSIGFWKNNIDKALAGKTNGVQVSKAALQSYTATVSSLALDPFAGLTMNTATSILSSKSSAAADLLAKQLVGSEYNYASGAYIGGSETLTYCFIYWGEWVLKNKASYSSSYLTWAKDWFDAYNNSHGGLVSGPNP